jgi:hypothetical protein
MIKRGFQEVIKLKDGNDVFCDNCKMKIDIGETFIDLYENYNEVKENTGTSASPYYKQLNVKRFQYHLKCYENIFSKSK